MKPRRALALVLVLLAGCSEERRLGLERDIERLDPRCGRETLMDQEIVVGAGGWQFMPFALTNKCSVTVTVRGLRDTGKGFRVDVTPANAGTDLKKGGKFSYHPEFRGLNVRTYSATHDLPLGGHGVLVQNSENLLFSMSVHVKVMTAPAKS